jgi:hypothetical protein
MLCAERCTQVADQVAAARVEVQQQYQGEAERLRVQEAKLRDEMALVRQQQLIHERLVEDVATMRSSLDACQAELRSKHEVRAARVSHLQTVAVPSPNLTSKESTSNVGQCWVGRAAATNAHAPTNTTHRCICIAAFCVQELGASNAEGRAYLDRLDRVKDYDVVLRQATLMRADMLAAKQHSGELEDKVRLQVTARRCRSD